MDPNLLYTVTGLWPVSPRRGEPGARGGRPVADLMTRAVVTITASRPVHEAARLMIRHHVGALAVVEGRGTLIGIVTAGDLTARLAPRRRTSWWTRVLVPERAAREYQRVVGTTVREIMTRPVVTVAPDADVTTAVALLETYGIDRLPVVADGLLVGIVGRADLVRLIAAPPAPAPQPSDADLVAAMNARLAAEPWAPRGIRVMARSGILTISGVVESQAEKAAIETMARSIDGCRGVRSDLFLPRALRPPRT